VSSAQAQALATAAGGLFVDAVHLRAMTKYVSAWEGGDRNAAVELVGYVAGLLDAWRENQQEAAK
jgi:hypothetical protein